MLQDLGREPTPDELAAELDITPEKLVEVQNHAREPMSLHIPLGEDGDSEFGDLIEDSEAIQPGEAVGFILLQEELQSVLGTLSEREAGVISMRFGLTDGQPKTLDEIGQRYGVTRERIRQIESKIMAKLRHPSRSRLLRDYLDLPDTEQRDVAPSRSPSAGRRARRCAPGPAPPRAVGDSHPAEEPDPGAAGFVSDDDRRFVVGDGVRARRSLMYSPRLRGHTAAHVILEGADLEARSNRLAHYLAEVAGLGTGDRVGYLLYNRLEVRRVARRVRQAGRHRGPDELPARPRRTCARSSPTPGGGWW